MPWPRRSSCSPSVSRRSERAGAAESRVRASGKPGDGHEQGPVLQSIRPLSHDIFNCRHQIQVSLEFASNAHACVTEAQWPVECVDVANTPGVLHRGEEPRSFAPVPISIPLQQRHGGTLAARMLPGAGWLCRNHHGDWESAIPLMNRRPGAFAVPRPFDVAHEDDCSSPNQPQ